MIHILYSYIIMCYKVDCKWNDWINGTCTKTCGGGSRTNTRTENVTAAHGGKACVGNASSEEICSVQPCPGQRRPLESSLTCIVVRQIYYYLFVIITFLMINIDSFDEFQCIMQLIVNGLIGSTVHAPKHVEEGK